MQASITFREFLQYSFYILTGCLTIWGIYKGFSLKADKKDLKALEKKVEFKVERIEYLEKSKELNDKINKKANQDVLDLYMKQTNQSYTALEERLQDIEDKQDESNKIVFDHYKEISVTMADIKRFMSDMKENCDREICKSKK